MASGFEIINVIHCQFFWPFDFKLLMMDVTGIPGEKQRLALINSQPFHIPRALSLSWNFGNILKSAPFL